MSYSFETKLAEIEYEIKIRRQVYPGSVAVRRMSQSQAEMKIAIMEAVAEDYRRAIARRETQQEPISCDTSSVIAAVGNGSSSA
jgi:hypothetical protein